MGLLNNGIVYKSSPARRCAIDDILRLGVMDEIREEIYNQLIVRNMFVFYPKTSRWRKVGSQTMYHSRGFADFYKRFVLTS